MFNRIMAYCMWWIFLRYYLFVNILIGNLQVGSTSISNEKIRASLQKLQVALQNMNKFQEAMKELKLVLGKLKVMRKTDTTTVSTTVVPKRRTTALLVQQPTQMHTRMTTNAAGIRNISNRASTTTFSSVNNVSFSTQGIFNISIEKMLPRNSSINVVRYDMLIMKILSTSSLKSCKDFTCKTLKKKFVTNDKLKKGSSVISTREGYFLNCEKKQFFMSAPFFEVDACNVWGACCKMGAGPAIIENWEEINCLKTHAAKLPVSRKRGTKVEFVVAGYDFQLNRTFARCPGSSHIPDELWAKGEPDNDKGIEACIALDLGKSPGLLDIQCFARKLQYLCQI